MKLSMRLRIALTKLNCRRKGIEFDTVDYDWIDLDTHSELMENEREHTRAEGRGPTLQMGPRLKALLLVSLLVFTNIATFTLGQQAVEVRTVAGTGGGKVLNLADFEVTDWRTWWDDTTYALTATWETDVAGSFNVTLTFWVDGSLFLTYSELTGPLLVGDTYTITLDTGATAFTTFEWYYDVTAV